MHVYSSTLSLFPSRDVFVRACHLVGGVDGTETVACVAGFTLGAAASLALARVVVVTTPAGFAWAAAGSAVIDSTFEGENL